MKFRKKPIVIEAAQWWPGRQVNGVVESPVLEPTPDNPEGCYGQVTTLEGIMTCKPGDWIITGVKGEKYPCRNDIFMATYECLAEDISTAAEEKKPSVLKEGKLHKGGLNPRPDKIPPRPAPPPTIPPTHLPSHGRDAAGSNKQTIIDRRLRMASAILTSKGWSTSDDLDLSNLELQEIPQLATVGGSFWCSYNRLTSLAGAPRLVGGDFYCTCNPGQFTKADVTKVCKVKGKIFV